MKQRLVTATEFKAKCLSLLGDAEEGQTITVTRRGRPIAKLAPLEGKVWRSPKGIWKGKAVEVRDLASLDHSDLWEALKPGGVEAE